MSDRLPLDACKDKFLGRLLIVDDDPETGALYQRILVANGFECDLAASLTTLAERLNGALYEAVLLDLELGSEDGLDGLALILRDAPATRVYILTAHGSIDRAVEAMRKGATGFFEKGVPPNDLVEELCSGTRGKEPNHIELANNGLIGVSDALEEILVKIERLRDVDSTVLLLGESGTGKEVIARTIHRSSKRSKFRFAAINCGAIPETLLESELFGHRRGAFTDAKSDRKGIFELSSSGTLLLDEIGDMPFSLQSKLLRVLQEREITPVGSSETIKIDTRIIAATHKNIFSEASAGRFREDLYYRLSIVVLTIPPLRDRVQDIPLLVEHFLAIYNQRFGRDVRMPNASEMARLMAYHWPGNIRELQNAIERAVVLSTNGSMDLNDVFASASGNLSENHGGIRNEFENELRSLLSLSLTEGKQGFERFYLQHYLKAYHGNVNEVAEKSGRYRADVYRLMSRYGIERSEFRH